MQHLSSSLWKTSNDGLGQLMKQLPMPNGGGVIRSVEIQR